MSLETDEQIYRDAVDTLQRIIDHTPTHAEPVGAFYDTPWIKTQQPNPHYL